MLLKAKAPVTWLKTVWLTSRDDERILLEEHILFATYKNPGYRRIF